ncbi:MAG TPA: tetratricopeptide repeat protein, partial [Baekduia sp.]|nr:tetratricopeptide repeat protein [Baekduia sp.]
PVAVPVPEAAGAEAAAVRRDPPREPVARQRSPHRRALMLLALAATCLVVGAGAALISDHGNNGARDTPAPTVTSSTSQGSPTGSPQAQSADTEDSTTTTAAPTASTPAASTGAGSGAASGTSSSAEDQSAADQRSAAQLNDTGYRMLPSDPQGALPLLSAAVKKFRAQGDTKSLNYAFSLYNYGWALRLAGRPAEAIPYLEERLRISGYKRDVVEQELRTAQQAAGMTPTADSGKATRKGTKKDKEAAGAGGFPGD